MSSFLTLPVILDIQPGEIPPTIHLKQGSTAVSLRLQIRKQEGMSLLNTGLAVIQATPPGEDVVEVVQAISSTTADYYIINLSETNTASLAEVAGEFKGSITIIDKISTEDWTEEDYVTTQPFIVAVQKVA